MSRPRINPAKVAEILKGETALTPPAKAFVYREHGPKAFQPSPQQAAIFEWVRNGQGSALVEAVAGAGKTTTLIKALAEMDGSIFFGAYNKKIAEEIKEKAEATRITRQGLFISTMHGAGFGAWRRVFPKAVVEDRKVGNLIKNYVQTHNLPDLNVSFVKKMVSFGKQFLFGCGSAGPDYKDIAAWSAMMAHFGLDSDVPADDPQMMAQLWEAVIAVFFASAARCRDQIDFDDMIFAPIYYNLRLFQNDWVLIDEVQDINPARLELARRMLKPGGRVLAVGDSRQSIYGFTGADSDAIEKVATTFGCARLPLTVTYRCPKAVVAYVQQWVQHIEAHPSAPEGSVRGVKLATPELGKQLPPWFLTDTPEPTDAILCRYVKPLVRTAFAMLRAGIACKIEGRDIGNGLKELATRWRITSLDRLTEKLAMWMAAEIAKAKASENERKQQEIEDRVTTLLVFVDRCRARGAHLISDLIAEIDALFDDNVKGMVTLSTGHKAKGREWPRVYWITTQVRNANRLKDWELEQEVNIQYVIGTRAQAELVLVPEKL